MTGDRWYSRTTIYTSELIRSLLEEYRNRAKNLSTSAIELMEPGLLQAFPERAEEIRDDINAIRANSKRGQLRD